jgi:succinate dehydrogenase / fumarate reductase, membrane anchor subunit
LTVALLTDRKRAEGLGAAGTGSHHHWQMTVSSALLLILVPLFIFTFGRALGLPADQAAAYYARPWPALVAALTFLVGMLHFRGGVQVMLEDYVHGLTRKVLILVMIALAYLLAAIVIFSVLRVAV